MSIQILEDVEEAIAREVRRVSFSTDTLRTTTVFKECFNPFTGELVRKPIEPSFYDETAFPTRISYPKFTIALLKLYEDLYSKRTLPSIGLEDVETLPSPKAMEIIIAGSDLATTNGSTTSDVLLTHLKIRNVTVNHLVRIITGFNKGTYRISNIALNGNGPHTITLSNDMLVGLPMFNYNPTTGIVTFREYVDFTSIKSGDSFVDSAANVFTILAVNVETSTLNIGLGQNLASTVGSKVSRTGDVLQQDDAGLPQTYKILDPAQLIPGKASKYRESSWMIPYSFLYYIKIVTTERDDHIAVADRMMHVFNPPRGTIPTLVRSKTSAEAVLKKDALVGETVLLLEGDAVKFYPNDKIRLHSDTDIGEELTVDSVNPVSNLLILREPITKEYLVTKHASIVSNYCLQYLERDFQNHVVEDDAGSQYWIHRFTFRIEAWVEARISPYTTEQTFEDSQDVNFIQAALETFEGDPLDVEVEVP